MINYNQSINQETERLLKRNKSINQSINQSRVFSAFRPLEKFCDEGRSLDSKISLK